MPGSSVSWVVSTSMARFQSPVVQKRSASAERSQGEIANGTPGRAPTTSTVVPASSAAALRRVAVSLTKTRVPSGAGTVSPSIVNVARPERTRYSSSCPPAPWPSSSCSPISSWPASVARHALIPNDSMPRTERIMCQRGRPSSA